MTMETLPEKDGWDKFRAVAAPVSTFIGAAVIAGAGHLFSKAMKDSENSVKYVEIAVSVLRADPTADTLALRKWAVDLLNDQAPYKMSEEAKAELKKYRVIVYDRGYVGTAFDGPGGKPRSFVYPGNRVETELAPPTDRRMN